ncbi:hypothetical protein ABZP36_031038, partial [Zizania latifolia]
KVARHTGIMEDKLQLLLLALATAVLFLLSKDGTFADRYLSTTIGMFTFGSNDFGFAPYGERWRQLRKLSTQELLSVSRVKSFQHIREDEVARLMRDLAMSAAGGHTVNLSEKMGKLVNDIIVRCSIGSRSKYRDEFLDALSTALRQMTWLTVADIFPSSKLARMVGTAPRKALACRKRIEHILEHIIQERKDILARRDCSSGEAVARSVCFLNVLLRLQDEGDTPILITNEIIVMLLFDMFVAGSETSSSTLNWIMAELIQSPRVMKKVCDEVRQACQRKNTITEDDVIRLNYLKMVIKETLRLHCPMPLLGPRKCHETCKVMGYDVPKDTTVFVNAWAICRDPKYWVDADEFKPERFEDMSIDLKGNNFEFLPFGSGRRMCPAISLGLANVELPLANLLYHFNWKLPNEIEPKDVDMLEASGFVGPKRTNMQLHPVAHIAPNIA